MTTFGCGWIRDQVDNRDKNVHTLLMNLSNYRVNLPDEVNLEAFTPTPFNQAWTSSCVGQSGKGAIYTAWRLSGVATPRVPSSLWLYSIARATHESEDKDEGTYIRGMCKAASIMGIAMEDTYPFDPAKVNARPTWKATRQAFDQKWLKGYYRILSEGAERLEDIKLALANRHVVIYGMLVDRAWQQYQGGVLAPTDAAFAIGGHATFLYGYYKNEYFLGQNSWGPNWGIGGRYRISQEALLAEHVADLTVLEMVPADSGT